MESGDRITWQTVAQGVPRSGGHARSHLNRAALVNGSNDDLQDFECISNQRTLVIDKLVS